jgi:hypothetical protein
VAYVPYSIQSVRYILVSLAIGIHGCLTISLLAREYTALRVLFLLSRELDDSLVCWYGYDTTTSSNTNRYRIDHYVLCTVLAAITKQSNNSRPPMDAHDHADTIPARVEARQMLL